MKAISFIIKRAEQRVRQRIFGGMIMSVALLMVLNSIGLLSVRAANQLQIDMTAAIDSGTFTITNGPTGIAFANQNYGAGNNVTGSPDLDGVRVTDYRGNAQAWGVVANATNLTNGSNDINANKLTLFANQIVFSNVQNFTTSRMNRGANGTLDGSGFSMVNGSTQASGIVQFDNGFVNFLYNGSDPAGTYTSTLYLTLS